MQSPNTATPDAELTAVAHPPGGRGQVGLLLAACVVLTACAALRASHAIAEGNFLNFVSGAWVALARDLAEGIFYRPLVSDDGFGGTRFFPLQFMCHAALIRAGLAPFAAGFVLSVTWTVLLLAGVFVFLRRSGATLALALAISLIPLASMAVFNGLVDIRGDVLPAALNIWGLAMCLGQRRPGDEEQSPTLGWAAIFFVLAFSAKITTVFGAAAAIVALFVNGRRGAAIRLATFTALGYIAVVALIYVASEGRIVEIFRACAAGGSSLKYFVQAPLRLVAHYADHDPVGLALAMMGIGGVLGMLATAWRDISSLAVIATLAVTLVIFGSPGTSFNHIIDLSVISVVFVAVQVIRQRVTPGFVVGTLAILAGFAAILHLETWRDTKHTSRFADMRRAVDLAGANASPGAGRLILSEDPLVPLMAGRRPYVLDSWMLRLMGINDPSVMQRLTDELRAKKFSAVVLLNDPLRDGGKYLEERVFGAGFVAPLLEHYERTADLGRFKVYLPKP